MVGDGVGGKKITSFQVAEITGSKEKLASIIIQTNSTKP